MARQIDFNHMHLADVPKAEGMCKGLPYDTQLVSSQGVNVHFWVKNTAAKTLLAEAIKAIKRERDVVSCTWSLGEPNGFWAHQDI